jgi:hypothetical protein
VKNCHGTSSDIWFEGSLVLMDKNRETITEADELDLHEHYEAESKIVLRAIFEPVTEEQERLKVGASPLRINELNRVVFQNKADAIDVLSHLLEEIEEYHVASIADFLSYSGIDVAPIHHKWGWYDLVDAAVVEDPDSRGFYIRLPKPVEI